MNQTIGVNITPQSFQPTLHYSQGDVGRVFVINVTDYDIPTGATVTCVATKPSGMGFTVSGTVSGNSVTFTSTAEMTDEWGRFPAEIRIASGNTLLGTANFLMIGEKDPHPASTIDGTQEELIPQLTLLVNRVEAAAESVHDLTVSATTLTAGSDATATYDSTNNSIAFGIPRGADGDVTRSEFNDLKSDIDVVINGANVTIQKSTADDGQAWGTSFFKMMSYANMALSVANNGNSAIWFTQKDENGTNIVPTTKIDPNNTAVITVSVVPYQYAVYADTYPINVNIQYDSRFDFIDGKVDALTDTVEDITVDYLEGKKCYVNLSSFNLSQNKYYSNDLSPLTPVDGNTYHIAQPFVVPVGTYSYCGIDTYWSFYVYGNGTINRINGNDKATLTLTQQATIYLTTRENLGSYNNVNWVSGNKIFTVAPDVGYFSEKIEALDGFTQVMASVNMFNSVAALGDSYTAASVQNSSGTWGDYPNNSWVATMCKRSGVDWFNYGHGGATTQSYLSTTEFASALSDTARDIYFICFGINDYSQSLTVGTVADINDSDYTQNAPSFYGWYGKIIAQIKAHAPKAKIVLIKPWTSAAAQSAYGDAVEGIASHYSIPCIDPYDDIMFYGGYLSASINGGHPTLMGYDMMGVAMERLFSESVIKNQSYYKYSTVG